MKIKVFPNPAFDFVIGLLGDIDEIPTKQDKYKPVKFVNPRCEDEHGIAINITDELYVLNEKKREGQKRFEEQLKDLIKENLKVHHPYKKPTQLEVVIGVTAGSRRYKDVDIDNLVKFILDCLNGLIYEDDSQIASLIASKNVINDKLVPEYPSVMLGIRVLSAERKMLNNIPIYIMEPEEED